MALSEDRKFATFRRGKVRDDIILARFRNTLRGKINPDSGQPFTEDEIAVITQEDSRFYIEADGIDLYGQAVQSRALWFVDQIHPARAASGFLNNFHGALWLPDGYLPATGGSGPVLASGSAGTIYVGSTTIGDPTASIARDPAGKRYQVLVTTLANSSGLATLQMQGIDTGDSTNPTAGKLLTWINPPLGTAPEAQVIADFSGGFNQETEAEFAQRIVRRIRNKPGAGNNAQFRIWAGQSSNAVQDAFVYSTALHSGSTIVAIAQKRGNTIGPNARVASIGTLTTATAFLTPPTSPVVPHGVHTLVVPMNPQSTNLAMTLSMPRGSVGGWADVDPWPRYSATFNNGVQVGSIISQTVFSVFTDQGLTGLTTYGDFVVGDNVPEMMLWNSLTSSFETLNVDRINYVGLNEYQLVLNSAPAKTVVPGDVVSPKNNREEIITEVLQDYFDELGPSELVLSTDVRFVRAARFPRPDQEYSPRAGQSIISRLDDQLGGALSDAELNYISQNTPSIPFEHQIIVGPNYLTLGRVGLYAFGS
ncbi:MAG: baseplate J/gp47 family protein [Parcubacteria group bacterium]